MKTRKQDHREHWETDYGQWAKKPEWSSRGASNIQCRAARARFWSAKRVAVMAAGTVVAAALVGLADAATW